jgi:hypothetical protein
LPGGLKAKGLRIKGDDTPISPGEFRDVDVASGSIRDNILPLPYKEPSQTLALLMDKVVEDGRRFAAVSDLKISDMSSQAPVGTTLAILERVLKVMSAVQARIYYTMKQEFKLLALIIRDNTPDEYSYEPEVGNRRAKKADYDDVDVIPVSDPNAATMSQKIVQYQAVLQLSQTNPQIYDLPYLHRQMIETMGIKNAAKIIPDLSEQKPLDPVTENMNLMNGKPVKAFYYQDHDAHLQVHMSMMNDPKIAQIVGQNPRAQQIMANVSAHIMEHVAFQYRKEIEKQLGVNLPPIPDEEKDENFLPEAVEIQVSQLAAAAAAKLLQKDMAEMQAQQIAQQQQDPVLQMQQQELQLKGQQLQLKNAEIQLKAQQAQQEEQRKQQKDVMDATAKAEELRLRERELQTKTALQMNEAASKRDVAGAKLTVEIAKARAQQRNQKPNR